MIANPYYCVYQKLIKSIGKLIGDSNQVSRVRNLRGNTAYEAKVRNLNQIIEYLMAAGKKR